MSDEKIASLIGVMVFVLGMLAHKNITDSVKETIVEVQIQCFKQTTNDDASSILHRIKCPEGK